MCHLYPYNNVKLLRKFFYINDSKYRYTMHAGHINVKFKQQYYSIGGLYCSQLSSPSFEYAAQYYSFLQLYRLLSDDATH